MATYSELAKTYHSFSGIDIKAVFGNVIVGELAAISISVTREKAPVFTMGSPNPRSFSRGKRAIAGTMIFTMFDRHPVLDSFGAKGAFYADKNDLRPSQTTPGSLQAVGSSSLATLDATGVYAGMADDTTDPTSDHQQATPWYADQLLPFDVTLSAANEYGACAVMRIYGCEFLNEGYGVSIDDLVSEKQHTYVARDVEHWKWMGNKLFPLQ